MSNLKVNTINDASGGSNAVLYGVAAPANSMGFRNRIINGAMVIDQRNAGGVVSTASGAVGYAVDRFKVDYSQTSKLTMQQNAGAVTPPVGFSNYYGITSSSAYSVLAGDYFLLSQPIEGFNTSDFAFGTASAATVTLSFWVRSSLTGTFGGSLQNSAVNRSYPYSYTISAANTWEQKTITIAGDTTGTWVGATNGIGLTVAFSLGMGSTRSGTAGAWAAGNFLAPTGATSVVGTSGATFYITGVQLEAGSVASPFERRDYGRELMMCQRYYQRINGMAGDYVTVGGAGVVASGTSAARLQIPMYVPMCYSPTSDIFSTALYDIGGLPAVTSVSSVHSTPTSYSFDLGASGGGLTVGRACMFLINPSVTNYVSLSAEL